MVTPKIGEALLAAAMGADAAPTSSARCADTPVADSTKAAKAVRDLGLMFMSIPI
jgi:hypothetical protein